MSAAEKKVVYPYISTNPKIANGVPIIEGTRTTVRNIVGYYQMGMSATEILKNLPHLTPSQVHSALAYYFDHQHEIDEDIRDNANLLYWQQQVLKHPHAGE